MPTNTFITPTMVAAHTLLMLRDRCDDPPAAAFASMDFDARDLTLTMDEYAMRVLIPVVGQLSDPTALDGRPRHPPMAGAVYDGTSLSIWERYDIGTDSASWLFRVVRH